jgi:hypothetical protein
VTPCPRLAMGPETRAAIGEAADWLEDYVTAEGGADFGDVKRDSVTAGHSLSPIKRAGERLRLSNRSEDREPAAWPRGSARKTLPSTSGDRDSPNGGWSERRKKPDDDACGPRSGADAPPRPGQSNRGNP